jgi:hypothetical protein
MNFARQKCDERLMQRLMQNAAFALRLGKESICDAAWPGMGTRNNA